MKGKFRIKRLPILVFLLLLAIPGTSQSQTSALWQKIQEADYRHAQPAKNVSPDGSRGTFPQLTVCSSQNYPNIVGSGFYVPHAGNEPSGVDRYRILYFSLDGRLSFYFTNQMTVVFESPDKSLRETYTLEPNSQGWLVAKDDQGNLPTVPFSEQDSLWTVPENSSLRMAMEPRYLPLSDRGFIYDVEYFKAKGLTSATFQNCYMPSCEETGGETGKDYFKKGTLSLEHGKVMLEDVCTNLGTNQDYSLIEYSCSLSGYTADTVYCPYGCEAGACKTAGNSLDPQRLKLIQAILKSQMEGEKEIIENVRP